jgi:hypothetical protein
VVWEPSGKYPDLIDDVRGVRLNGVILNKDINSIIKSAIASFLQRYLKMNDLLN